MRGSCYFAPFLSPRPMPVQAGRVLLTQAKGMQEHAGAAGSGCLLRTTDN